MLVSTDFVVWNSCLYCLLTFCFSRMYFWRWRILKTGVRLQSTCSVDHIWLTCCAFHNWLLKTDGLDKLFDGVNAVTSKWANELGKLDEQDIPLAMRRLLSPSEIRDYDLSRMGGTDARNLHGEFEDNNEDNNKCDIEGTTNGDTERQR
mmetsp:Transcript_5744/g.7056  ORF Transcript_5744/g.7056 Transcript_5744/m.7056 type:complete len:149 (+) Transcript_5744:254-700(+)